MTKYSRTIDISKGIAIILMVLGHSNSPFTHFIYLFHMSFFFIVAGLCFNEKHTLKEFISWIYKKVKRIYIPFLLTTILFILLHNMFIDINFYTYNDDFLNLSFGNRWGLIPKYSYKEVILHIVNAITFTPSEQLLGGNWFLPVYFFSIVIYGVIKLCKFEKYITLLICMFLSAYGFYHNGSVGAFQLYVISTCVPLIMIGDWLKNTPLKNNHTNIQLGGGNSSVLFSDMFYRIFF